LTLKPDTLTFFQRLTWGSPVFQWVQPPQPPLMFALIHSVSADRMSLMSATYTARTTDRRRV